MVEPPGTGAASPHVKGDVLVAVADGRTEGQPSEETLAHVFSCGRCRQALQEIRSGLSLLECGNTRDPSLEDGFELEALFGDPEEVDPLQLARRTQLRLAIFGVLVVLVLLAIRYLFLERS